MTLAAWRIESSGPSRLSVGFIELEKSLEDWIENDPGLIDPGLLVLRRQMHIEGGILDLLCVDQQGRPTIIEIKRGKLIRETIAQGIDYASSIAAMSDATLREHVQKSVTAHAEDHPGYSALLASTSDSGEREVAVVVVGIGQAPGLERMIDFLGSGFGVPIRAVTFDVFDLGDGQKVLIREETEPEVPAAAAPASSYSIASVVELAGGPESPNGRRMTRLADAAKAHDLYVRPYKWSLMFTPAAKKTRYLMTVWSSGSENPLRLSFSAAALAEFFPVTPERVQEVVGLAEGAHSIRDDADCDAWVGRIHDLFSVIGAAGDASEGTSLDPLGA